MIIEDIWLLLAASLALFFGRKSPQAYVWIGAGALSYALSSIYWRLGLPHGAVVAFCCDATVCFSIYIMYRQSWERTLFAIFLLSATVNLIYVFGVIVDHSSYSLVLEILNYLALLVIGGHHLTRKSKDDDLRHSPNGGLRGYMARVGPSFLRNDT